MTMTGLPGFDTTVHETNQWLRSLMSRLETDDRRLAYAALRSTLHALRDRLGVENAAHLSAQLPMLVRGLYYEGWRPGKPMVKERHKEQFLQHIAGELDAAKMPLDAEDAATAVFDVMAERLDPGEVVKMLGLLPAELREMLSHEEL